MAEKLCELKKKGGGGGATYTETVLWQNPSPSSDFAAQTITLSDGMSNYDYLALAFTAHKTSTDAVRTIISVTDFGKLENVLNKPQVRFGGYNSTPTSVSRQFLKVSDTSISIGAAYYVNTSGSSNSYAIPIQVVGIKKGRVPSYKTVKDFIYDKVFNSGLPEITYVAYSRATITEGKVVADAVARKVYAYFDFTMNNTQTSGGSWDPIATLNSSISSYLPIYATNSRSNNLPMITDDSSDVPTARFAFGYGTSNSMYKVFSAYGTTYHTGDHYIIYTEYTY